VKFLLTTCIIQIMSEEQAVHHSLLQHAIVHAVIHDTVVLSVRAVVCMFVYAVCVGLCRFV
jgi:hypothetical protein